MIVGTCLMRLHLPGSRSLKDKRGVVKGLLEKLRNRFGVAAAEVGDLDLWDAATLGVACVCGREEGCRRILDGVLRFSYGAGPWEVVETVIEIR